MIEDHSYKLSLLKNLSLNNKIETDKINNSITYIKWSKLACRVYLQTEIILLIASLWKTRKTLNLNSIGVKTLFLYFRLNLVWYFVLNGTNYVVNQNTNKIYNKYLNNKDKEGEKGILEDESLNFKKFIKHTQD